MAPTARQSRSSRPRATAGGPASIGAVPIPGDAGNHPEVGLGLWNRGRWTHDETERVEATIERALAAGVRWFDTAEVYGAGRSERVLGGVLSRHPGIDPPPFVVSKVSWEHLRPTQLRAAIQGSLERLDRPSLDLYLVHAPDARVPIGETMQELQRIADEGRIRAIGVSNFTVPELEAAQAALAPRRIVANQVRYSLLDREEGDAVREHCARHGILLEAYSPLCHGLLAGRYLPTGEIPAAARRGVRLFDADHLPATLAAARKLAALAARAQVPLAAIALRWLRRQGALPIFGATSPDQVDANLAAWAAPVPPELLDAADEIARNERA